MVYEIVKVASRKRNISSVLIGRLSEDKIPFKFLEQDNFTIRNAPSSSDNLIINFHNFDGLSKLRDIKGKSIIWGILAPQILDWNRFGLEKKLTGRKILGDYFTKKLMVDMHRKSSLISMDGATSDALDGFVGNRINWPIISIPVDISSAIAPMARNSKSSTVLQVSYIGRSDNAWKIKPVKKFIRDINKIKNKIFNINIYTDSPAPFNEELKYSCDEHVSIVYHVGLYGP